MKKLNELEDTLEKQERKELIFEMVYKLSLPIIILIALVIAFFVKVDM
jgi:hypothetical protein